MPSVSEKQRRFFGAELGRKRAGEETETKMSEDEMAAFASALEKPPPKRKEKAVPVAEKRGKRGKRGKR